MNPNKGLTRGKKILIISLMSFIIVLLSVIAILLSFNFDKSRTIMIFMSGNNLESDHGLASDDLAGIVPENIDLEKTHVLLYTGGTKRWHNFASSDENAIYELKSNGFEKVKSYEKSDMGLPLNLTTFLNYSYDNYKSGRYDLVMWDHGGASYGSIYDENSGDGLLLSEIGDSLKNSRFNSNNKIETIIFRTCLNGTLEMASVLSPYAEYMVASEEVTRGATGYSVLDFINNVNENVNGREFGELFITSYKAQMDDINEQAYTIIDSTYSIINLNKMASLYDKMNTFFNKIDVDSNYRDIARIRSSMHQYARESSGVADYDTVDLYELIDNLKIYSPSDAESIKTLLKNDVIASNWSTNTHSNGLSVYFPYYGSSRVKEAHLSIYDRLSASDSYKKFIKEFYNNQTNKKNTYSFDLLSKEVKKDGKEFKLKLNKEEQENYSKAGYIIFRKEADGLFMPVYRGDDAKVDKDGYLTTKLSNNLIKVVDERDNSTDYFTIMQVESTGKTKEYKTEIIMNYINIDEPGTSRIDQGTAHFAVDGDNVHLDKIYLVTKDEEGNSSVSSATVNVDDYTSLDFPKFRYNILDAAGNYTTNWESSATKYMFEVTRDAYHFELASLDDGDYYCVFAIYDSQNNVYYSNLISLK